MPSPELIDDIWRQQSLWSQAADRMKRRIGRARLLALTDTCLVAVLGALAVALSGPLPVAGRVLAALAAFGAAVLTLLRPAWSGQVLRDWTRARSVSEGLKTEVYLWLARAGAYRDDPRAMLVHDKTAQIRHAADDLLRHQMGLRPRHRPLPAVHDLASYFAVRVAGQVDGYYRLQAAALARRLRRFRVAEIVLAVAATALGAAASIAGGILIATWIAVVMTLAAALTVHVAATRYDYQLIEYLRTAEQLEDIRTAVATAAPEELDRLAVRAEGVISVENQAWMAKLVQDPPDHGPARPRT
ncbi:DUF4231 domain-containing protein [Amycolatopsis sp. NPDC003731]